MTEIKRDLCILITNAFIRNWTGSELYVRDLAIGLIKRGYKPIVYSPRIGKLADEFRSKSIPVVRDLNSIKVKPDLIHGQHHMETMTALLKFPETPAVFFCHGWMPWEEIPPVHPRIIQYVTVSDALHDRLVYECGIPSEKISTVLNSVDLERFQQRTALPIIPKRALVFNNQVTEANILGTIREACVYNNMTLDVVGYGCDNPSFTPEIQLGNYDIIFAVGRSAIEGLASGVAVICCSLEGVSQMTTTQNLDWLRRNNFGIRVLNRPLTTDVLSTEIQNYDSKDALNVTCKVRKTAGLDDMIDQILSTYNSTLISWEKEHQQDPVSESLALSTYLQGISEKIDQVIIESNFAHTRAENTQNEINAIKGTVTWRLYQHVVRISFIHKFYMIWVYLINFLTNQNL